MTTVLRCLCFICVVFNVLARPHAVRQHRQINRRNQNNGNNFLDDSDVDTYVKERKQCELLNDCNGKGRCVTNFPNPGKATCDCEEGYFGNQCEIAPFNSMRCFTVRNGAHQSEGATCPEGQHCILDDFHCFFFECPIAKGSCIPEKKLLGHSAAERKPRI